MIFIYLVVILLAYWVFKDAQNHGYKKEKALLWALGVGLPALTWIVLPLYLLWGRRTQMKAKKEKNREIEMTTLEGEAVIQGDVIDCPMCAKTVAKDAKFCSSCGYTLHLVCTNCGEAMEREWQYCPQCQTKAPQK